MNFDEFESKLRSQPRREIPPGWRREILSSLRVESSAPIAWWRQLLWPHPAAWASIAAAWIAIFALNFAGDRETTSPQIASKPSPDVRLAYEERQRLWAELLLDVSPETRERPGIDRPRSHARPAEVAV